METYNGVMPLLPLNRVRVESLDDLFQEELSCWKEQLNWDYTPVRGLLRSLIASRSLAGFVQVGPSQKATGYAYFVINPPIAFIGGVFMRTGRPKPDYQKLVDCTVSAILHEGRVERIEAQVFPFHGDPCPAFESVGFRVTRRQFLSRKVADPHPQQSSNHRQDPVMVLGWNSSLASCAAAVIYDSYRDSIDLPLSHNYQSFEGCLDFVRNLQKSPFCGTFSPQTTLAAVDATGRVCGVILGALIGQTTGMISQLSIRRDFQGKGVGSFLLGSYLNRARDLGLQKTTLSVSEANLKALNLYRRFGFEPRKHFYAFIWERAGEHTGRLVSQAV